MQEQRSLYRSIWRWHFYAGLFCIPFIIVLSVSGAIYLFKPQIDAFNESAYIQIDTGAVRATPNQQIAAALQTLPNAQFNSYRLPKGLNDAVLVNVNSQGERFLVYVNPFTLEVVRRVSFDSQFIEWVKNLHGELLTGTVGSILVELAASWAIIMILTGLYLWWPRNSSGIAGIIYPRLNLKGRKLWKELHSVIGFWISIFTLFLLMSGLPWTTVWGSSFKQLRQFATHLESGDWSTSRTEEISAWQKNIVSEFNLSPATLLTAEDLHFAWPAELSVSNGSSNEWKLSSMTQNRPLRQTAWIDGGSGNIIKESDFSSAALTDRIIGYGIAIHEGQLFGWLNQLLGLITALGLLILSATGFVLWWQKKPKDRLGAPPTLDANLKAYWLLIPALLLPTLFVSCATLIVIERLVLQHLPLTRRWLGLVNE